MQAKLTKTTRLLILGGRLLYFDVEDMCEACKVTIKHNKKGYVNKVGYRPRDALPWK